MYTRYFGFRETPFSVTPDPRFFYTNPLYQEAFATLLYGIKAKKGFIVITGEVGTGKTTLLRKLMRNLEVTVQSVFIFNTCLVFPQLLQLTLQDLGLDPKRKSTLALVQGLNKYLIQQLQKGRTVCLLVDEAQNLSEDTLESLRLLSNLETDKEKLLQIVLMGQPELETKLDQPKLRQLKQRVALHCRLAPLKDQEVSPYIDFRLRAVGYEGPDLFNPDAIQQIAFYSRGIPRLINIICDNALLIAYAKSQKKVSADMIREVARDLRLGMETQTAETQTQISNVMPTNGRKLLAWQLRSRQRPTGSSRQALLANKDESPKSLEQKPFRRQPRHLVRIGLASLLLILLLGGAISVIHPLQNKWRLELFKHKLNEWLAVLISSEAEQVKVDAYQESKPLAELAEIPSEKGVLNPGGEPLMLEGGSKPISSLDLRKTSPAETKLSSRADSGALASTLKESAIAVKKGSTIGEVAAYFYGGANSFLGMDLIKEFNPDIKDLNWVFAGQGLRLPSLTRENLLRKQTDGSYHLILASFPSSRQADQFTSLLRYKGYQAVISLQGVSENFSLHRVQIAGLENLEAANQAWDSAVANRWLLLPDSFAGVRMKEQDPSGPKNGKLAEQYNK